MADKTDRAQPSVSERLGGARLWGNFDTSSKTVDGRFGEGLAVEVLGPIDIQIPIGNRF